MTRLACPTQRRDDPALIMSENCDFSQLQTAQTPPKTKQDDDEQQKSTLGTVASNSIEDDNDSIDDNLKMYDENFGSIDADDNDNLGKPIKVDQNQNHQGISDEIVNQRGKFRGFQRSFSCNYGSNEHLPDLTHLLRDSDTWRDPQEVNCFLKNCECTPRSAKTRKISFVRFEDEVTSIAMETVDETNALLQSCDSDNLDNSTLDGGTVENTQNNEVNHNETSVDTNDDAKQFNNINKSDALYSVKEEDLDENENTYQIRETVIHLYPKNPPDTPEVKQKKNSSAKNTPNQKNDEEEKNKKNFFKSIFSRSSSTTSSPKLQKSTSVVDVSPTRHTVALPSRATSSSPNTSPPKRQNSFLKKTLDGASKLKRSLSVRRLSDKRDASKSRETLTDVKNREWAASLQSLVETDIGVSYNDLSFVDYDRNGDSLNYNKYLSNWSKRNDPLPIDGNALPGNKCIYRTQSMIVNKGNTPHFVRHKSVSSITNWRNQSTALSRRHLADDSDVVDRVSSRRIDKSVCGVDDDDFDNHAKSLPCLVHKRSKKDRKLRGRSLPYTHVYQDECFNIAEWPLGEDDKDCEYNEPNHGMNQCHNLTSSSSSILESTPKTTKLRRQNACRQKSTPAHPSMHARHLQSHYHHHQCDQCGYECGASAGSPNNQCQHNEAHQNLTQNLSQTQSPWQFQFPAHRETCEVCRPRVPNHSAVRVRRGVGGSGGSASMRDAPPTEANSDQRCRSLDLLVESSQDSDNVDKDSMPQQEQEQRESPVTHPDGVRVYSDGRREITTVRSRSLNHLDTLEMRQGNSPTESAMATSAGVTATCTPSPEGHLKDAKSESDCIAASSTPITTTSTTITRPLLAPPEHTMPTSVSPPNTSPSPTYRRHMLSRSQKSSSECFSVNFEVGDESTYDTELFFPAARGVTLHESLTKLCELRNIELSTCDVWLCDRESNVQSWLSLSQDTACLVGKHVKVTAKDGRTTGRHLHSGQPLQAQLSLQQHPQQTKDTTHYFSHSRKLSGNFRPRTTSFFSSSTEECSTGDYEGNKKITKQRWSTNLFGNSKEGKQSMEQLIEHLNHYSRYGVPHLQNYTLTRSDSHDALNKLEDDWREIIDVTELSEKQQKQQTALWELIKTEVAYIKTLKVVTDLFLACLINLQASNILRDIDTNKLFSNISDILDANVQFWRNYLFPLVKDMRTNRNPPCLETMCDGFLKLKDCFHAYYRFCGEQSRCQHYCRENLSHNELFTAYLAWCETQKECNRLRLMDILVQPMQRLTKYGLLLKAILRNTDDDVDRDNLNIMIRSVDDFVNNVNFSLKQKQDNERLKGIIARIESYDIVETKDDDLEKLVKNYNQLDLTKPMLGCPPERRRHLLLEGDLKFKDSNTSKIEVHCFLLTDMLLVCKQSTKKGGATMRVIRMPYLIDKLVVTEINKETPTLACVYKNELDMAIGAFLLQNSDAKKLKSWKEGICKAQTLYTQAKISFLPTEPAESVETDYSFDYAPENDYHFCLQAPRSPLASSSRASRVSSLAHSHSGSVEMNDQSSLGSCKAVSVENDNRTASISSDEGVTPLPADQKSPSAGGSAKSSFKGHRIFNKTPNTLSVQPTYAHHLGQSLPNLALGSPNTLSNNTLSVPSTSKNGHLLSPTHRGISYPPPSPTRGNLRRGMAINQSKNPPLIKTRHVVSSAGTGVTGGEFDVPVIAGVSPEDAKDFGDFSRGHHRQAMKRAHRSDNRRYHTAGTVDDIKKEEASTSGIQKRSSWNCSSSSTSTSTNLTNQDGT